MQKSPIVFIGLLMSLVQTSVVIPDSAYGDIYKYVDANGVIHFTNAPTSTEYNFYMKEGSRRSSVKELISHYADMFGLDPHLVYAVIKVESNFNPNTVSHKGAQGLMQLIPETAREMEVKNPFNPEENIRGGSRYLRLMLDQFDGDLELALAAYNAGPGSVRRHGGIPPYEETRNYVERVKRYLQHYQQGKETLL